MAENHDAARRFVLLTGAAGRIGTAFRAHAGERYRFRLADRVTTGLDDTPGSGHEIVRLDVADADGCRAACRAIDTVIHLAADPSPAADFDASLLENNIRGTYNIFRAAHEQGCRRVIFASSVQAMLAYPPDMQRSEWSAVRPLNMYGASKCFGEAVASCFAFGAGLSSIVVRIGAYDAEWLRRGPTAADLSAYVSHRDLNQLLTRCVDIDAVQFAIVHGLSNNRFKRLDLTGTRELLGYAPEDDGFALYGEGLLAPPDPPSR